MCYLDDRQLVTIINCHVDCVDMTVQDKFKYESCMLYQLRNLRNQRNVMSDPRNDVNSCEDFFLLGVTANILAPTMEVFGDAESE